MIDTGVKRSIVRNLQGRGAEADAPPGAPAGPDELLRANRTRSSWPTARRPGRARLHRRDRLQAGRKAARLRDLSRPPAALPSGRPRDLQAAVRTSRRQPPGQGPDDRPDRDHEPEPRLRSAGPGRRQNDRRRRAGPLGDGLRRRRAQPHQPSTTARSRVCGCSTSGANGPVPPRSRSRAARRPIPVRPLRRGDPCRGVTTSTRSCCSGRVRS